LVQQLLEQQQGRGSVVDAVNPADIIDADRDA
jgi:hypothetical protein